MRISHSTNTNLTRKIIILFATLGLFPVVAFLLLSTTPTLTAPASATTSSSETSVQIEEVLSLRIVKQNPSTGEWDIDTDAINTTTRHGTFGHSSVKVIASTNAPGGYALSLSDDDNNTSLASTTVLYSIPTLSGNRDLTDLDDSTGQFPENTWGYNWVKDGETPNYTFSPVPSLDASASTKQKDSTNELGTNSYLFTIGTRVSTDTPAATYKDQIIFTLIGNPSPDSPLFFRTPYMQDFDQRTCNTVKAPLPGTSQSTRTDGNDYFYEGGYATKVPTTTIKDKRDEQEYTIRKLADGNCWMTENLRFGITLADAAENPSSPNPWSSTTNPAANTNTTEAGASVMANETNGLIDSHIITVRTGAKGADDSTAFSDVDEYYQKPYIAIYDANLIDNVSGTGTRFGVLYNYCAATGGTACTAKGTTPTVSGSICPTNWTLPTFTAEVDTVDGTVPSYNNLTAAYSITKNTAAGVTAIIDAPLSFPRAGGFYDGTLGSRSASGNGYYWSSTPNGGTYAYILNFYGTETISRNSDTRRRGRSVRCVLQ